MDNSWKERFVLSYSFREFSPWLHSPIPKVIMTVGAWIPGVTSLNGRQKEERREPELRLHLSFSAPLWLMDGTTYIQKWS